MAVQIEQSELEQIADAVAPVNLDAASVIIAVSLVAVAVVVAGFARRAIRRIGKGFESIPAPVIAMTARFAGYAIVGLGILGALSALGIDLIPLLGGLGLLVVVLAFVLQPFLENFAAGIILQTERPIEIGDFVIIDEFSGKVLEMKARVVVIKTIDGEVASIPNKVVLSGATINYTSGRLKRTTLDVGLARDTDLEAATRLIATAIPSVEGVAESPAPEVLVHEFADSTINAAVRFWHEPSFDVGWEVRHKVAVEVKRTLDANGMVVAFPQRVLWPGDGQNSIDLS